MQLLGTIARFGSNRSACQPILCHRKTMRKSYADFCRTGEGYVIHVDKCPCKLEEGKLADLTPATCRRDRFGPASIVFLFFIFV